MGNTKRCDLGCELICNGIYVGNVVDIQRVAKLLTASFLLSTPLIPGPYTLLLVQLLSICGPVLYYLAIGIKNYKKVETNGRLGARRQDSP